MSQFFTLLPLLLPVLAPVAQEGEKKQEPAQIEVRKAPPILSSADVVGLSIQNEKQETYGRVEDLVLHPKGEVAFAVCSYAGWLDEREDELFVVPWLMLRHEPERKALILDMSKDGIRDAPRFEAEEWRELGDMEWWTEADEYYEDVKKKIASPVEAKVSLAPSKMLYRLSKTKGEQVWNLANEKIGEIREIALDPEHARIVFALISVGGYLGTGERVVAVPWEALKTIPDASNPKIPRLALETTKERLQQAPEFRAVAEKPPMQDPHWILSVYEFYSIPPYWSVRTEGGGGK